MAEGPATIESDGYTITSTHETAEEMVKTFEERAKEPDRSPRVIKPIPDKPKAEAKAEKEPDVSQAASVLGKKGGAAAAEARHQRSRDESTAGDVRTDSGADAGSAGDAGAADEGEDAVAGATPEGEKPLGKPRDDPRARMLQATRQAAELKRQLAERDAELNRLRYERQARTEPQQQEQDQKAQRIKEKLPFKPEDFPEYEDYLDARDEWREQQWEAKKQAEQEVNSYASMLDRTVVTFRDRIEKHFGAEYESKVSEEVRSLRPSFTLVNGELLSPENVIADEIVSSEQAPLLLAHFSEHPEDLQRLATLPSPQAVGREMAKIEARLEAAPTVKPASRPAISQAKPPVRTVTGSPQSADDEISEDMSYDEHVRVMNAKERRKR